MKRFSVSLNRAVRLTLISAAFLIAFAALPSSPVASAVRAKGAHASESVATRVPLDSTTTTTTTTITTTTITNSAIAEPISDGPSRGECITPDVAATSSLAYLQSLVNSFDILTGTDVTCLSAYLDNAQTWSQWVKPWVTGAVNGYSSWVAQDPLARQLVLEVDLIPQGLNDPQNPMSWERSCAAGRYDGYATALGRSLVAAGLQNSVIRLGAEMNGNWEPDFIGTKVVEQRTWAKCFDNEVSGLRRAQGEHFLIDWNPNACAGNYPYTRYYPGNAYVNIVGIDLYDIGCITPTTRLTFSQLAGEQLGLRYFEAFAKKKKKPMSIPEWALSVQPSGDDPGYISGMGSTFDTGNFAFEAYFDVTDPSQGSLALGANTPLSLVAFRQWFASP